MIWEWNSLNERTIQRFANSACNDRRVNSDIASRWVHREFNLMFKFNSDKNRKKNSIFRSLSSSVNEPLELHYTMLV